MGFPTADIAERVNRGAEWLDALYPEWWTRIDLADLDLADGCRCVLGQLFATEQEPGGYNVFLAFRIRAFGLAGSTANWTYRHGFFDSAENFSDLDEAWILAIKERADRGFSPDDSPLAP